MYIKFIHFILWESEYKNKWYIYKLFSYKEVLILWNPSKFPIKLPVIKPMKLNDYAEWLDEKENI